MKSRRGAANIDTYNSVRSDKNQQSLKRELARCKKRNIYFKSLSAIAAHIQDITGIHRTTLINRNPVYRDLLEQYLIEQSLKTDDISDEDAPALLLQKRLRQRNLQISNLKARIEELEAINASRGDPLLPSSSLTSLIEGRHDYESFADTAMVLIAVLSRLNDSLSIDFEKKEILDLAAKPSERVIAGPKRTKAFIEWLQRNEHLLLGISKE